MSLSLFSFSCQASFFLHLFPHYSFFFFPPYSGSFSSLFSFRLFPHLFHGQYSLSPSFLLFRRAKPRFLFLSRLTSFYRSFLIYSLSPSFARALFHYFTVSFFLSFIDFVSFVLPLPFLFPLRPGQVLRRFLIDVLSQRHTSDDAKGPRRDDG